MVVIFLFISLVFLFALVVVPISIVAVSLGVWGRRHEDAAPAPSDLAVAAPARSDFAI